jgi:hypothetical protein
VKRHRQRQWHADSNGVTETQGNAVTHPVSNDGSYYQLRTTTEQIPDPSEDPTSEKGRTPSARARPGPLIARRKGWCAWEGAALSVHSRLHEEFRGRLELAGMDRETADRELFGWYGATEDAWRGQDIGEDLFEFWRKRFKEWRGTTPTKSNEELARERRRTELQARITGQEAAKR